MTQAIAGSQALEIATVEANPATFREFDTPMGELTSELEDLKTRGLSIMTVNLAQDWDTRAKKYLEDAEASPQNQTVKKAWAVARDLSAWFKKATDPVQEGRKWASEHVFGPWDQKEKARLAAEQREREEEARKQQERQLLEEAYALALDHPQDARSLFFRLAAGQSEKQALETLRAVIARVPDLADRLTSLLPSPDARPEAVKAIMEEAATTQTLPPVALPAPKAAAKVQGRVTIDVFTFGRIDDPKKLAQYFVEHPEDLIALMEPKLNEWKRRATSAKGTWTVPGVTFVKGTETRNRG